MVANWFGGMWASFIILFFWLIRPNLPYYTNLVLPWELSGNLADWFAASPVTPNLEEKFRKKKLIYETLSIVYYLFSGKKTGVSSLFGAIYLK